MGPRLYASSGPRAAFEGLLDWAADVVSWVGDTVQGVRDLVIGILSLDWCRMQKGLGILNVLRALVGRKG